MQEWEFEPFVWSEKLAKFYQQTKMAIVGNSVWNRRTEKLQMRQWIGHYLAKHSQGPLDILTVGDGAGFDSLYLAQCGHRVTYSEECTIDQIFAAKIFQNAGVKVHMIRSLQEMPELSFDAVLCLDVLEHVPDPPDFVASLLRYLRVGGHFIVHAPFFFLTPDNPTHLKANRKYSGNLSRLYKANGLKLIDGCFFWNPLVLEKTGPGVFSWGRRPFWCLWLRVTGMLLAIGRWWNWPHNKMATRAMQRIEPQWLNGLET
jgi:2-polyprenyl-3-methyl-5-hydroxy-6-metoxy-1,4-benzoquinol methylase